MDYLLDTNIILHYVRNSAVYQSIDQQLDLFGKNNYSFASIVSVGEMYSLAIQLGWGKTKMEQLKKFLGQINPIPVENNLELIQAYAAIDAYSQGKHRKLRGSFSARNMGKNDLWIAATAYLYDLTLVSLDGDFSHLDEVFFRLINPEKSLI
ncbi:MAG: type II toxin-antitoxin system VapC family toxin [Flammeovirgaceae bacterium]